MRILLMLVSVIEIAAAVIALCLTNNYALTDFLTSALPVLLAAQIVIQSAIWVTKWIAIRKQTAEE